MAEEYDMKTDELIGESQVLSSHAVDVQYVHACCLINHFLNFQSEGGAIKAHLGHRASGR